MLPIVFAWPVNGYRDAFILMKPFDRLLQDARSPFLAGFKHQPLEF